MWWSFTEISLQFLLEKKHIWLVELKEIVDVISIGLQSKMFVNEINGEGFGFEWILSFLDGGVFVQTCF